MSVQGCFHLNSICQLRAHTLSWLNVEENIYSVSTKFMSFLSKEWKKIDIWSFLTELMSLLVILSRKPIFFTFLIKSVSIMISSVIETVTVTVVCWQIWQGHLEANIETNRQCQAWHSRHCHCTCPGAMQVPCCMWWPGIQKQPYSL